MNASKRWMCDRCGSLHHFHDDAQECCPTPISEVYVCDKCEDQHDTKEEADACCFEPKILNDAEIRAELEARGQLRLVE